MSRVWILSIVRKLGEHWQIVRVWGASCERVRKDLVFDQHSGNKISQKLSRTHA